MELIGKNQLKIHLGPEDISYFKLSDASLDYRDEHVRSFFWEIMKIAKEEKGFDAFDSRLILKTQKNDNGFLMTVTRESRTRGLFRVKNSLTEKKFIRPAALISLNVFRFEDLEDLISCCAKIKNYDNILYNALYRWHGHYYLTLAMVFFKQGERVLSSPIIHILSEYAIWIDRANFEALLREYADEVIPFGALEEIHKTFKSSQ